LDALRGLARLVLHHLRLAAEPFVAFGHGAVGPLQYQPDAMNLASETIGRPSVLRRRESWDRLRWHRSEPCQLGHLTLYWRRTSKGAI
jgi:hypothetical protein